MFCRFLFVSKHTANDESVRHLSIESEGEENEEENED